MQWRLDRSAPGLRFAQDGEFRGYAGAIHSGLKKEKMMTLATMKVAAVVVATGLLAGGMVGEALAAESTTRPAQSRLDQAQKALDADLAALRRKGEPVTPQDLIGVSLPDAENAAVDLRAAFRALKTTTAAFDAYNKMESIRLPLAEKDAANLRAVVKENQRSLDLIRSAVAKGKVDWQVKCPSPIVDVLLPDLAGQRNLGNLAHVAALVAHEDGKDLEALEHVRQLLFIAHAAGQQPFLVSHIVELGIENLAFDVCRQISSRLQLDNAPAQHEEVRRTIAELLDEKNLRADLRWSLQGERVVHVDMAQALASGPATRDQMLKILYPKPEDRDKIRVKPSDLGAVALEDAHLMVEIWARNIGAVGAVDWPTAHERMNPWPPPELMEPPGTHFFMKTMWPSLERAFEKHYVAMAQRRLAATALAIRWYSLEHEGKLPESLEELVPKYLPTVPADPLAAGAPLIFSPESDALYSVGRDGKDDGGDPTDDTPQNPDIVVPLR